MPNPDNVIVMDKFIPRSYQLEFMRAVENNGYKKAICVWPRRCIGKGTFVALPDGTEKPIEELKPGDEILSYNKQACRRHHNGGRQIEVDRVSAVWNAGVKQAVRVTSQIGSIVTTKDHKFYSGPVFGWVEIIDTKSVYGIKRCLRKTKPMLYRQLRRNLKFVGEVETWDLETERNHNFFANGYLVHNSGKDICAWNLLIRAAVRDVGSYIYCLPSFSMCRRVLLNSKLHDGSSFMDFIPRKLVSGFNQQEMKITLINGSIIIMVGSDNADKRIVGMAAKGLVISEAALANPVGIAYLMPMITASDGFFIGISTPRSKNSFYDLYTEAKRSDDWYTSKLTIDDTKHVPIERIEADIASGIMSRELAQQEWWTSFSSTNQGAYYGKYLDNMYINDQITEVPYEPSLQTYCFMDLGINDMFTILFVQVTSLTIRIFDYYENHSEGLEHYANIIKGKEYGQVKVYAPHDIKVRELTTGISRLEKMRSLGLDTRVVANLPINDGIEAVRTILPKTYIAKKKCKTLVSAIENYTKEYDEAKQVYKDRPLHNKYCFTGDTLVLVADGPSGLHRSQPIENLRIGDYVVTPLGIKRITDVHSRRTRFLTNIYISGRKRPIQVTKTHEFFTQRGLVQAKNLAKGAMLEPASKWKLRLWNSLGSLASNGKAGFKCVIKNVRRRRFLPKGNSLMETYSLFGGHTSGLYDNPYSKLKAFKRWRLVLADSLLNYYYSIKNMHKVESIHSYESLPTQRVYDLTVEDDHCYYADGYLVSNSHANDALRYLAVSHKRLASGMTAEDLDERYARAVNRRHNLPRFFR